MQSPSFIPELRRSRGAQLLGLRAHGSGIRDLCLVGLMLLVLVRSSEALAGEPGFVAAPPLPADFGKFRVAPPLVAAAAPAADFTSLAATDNQLFSATEFRPRKHIILDTDRASHSFGENSMLRDTTVWQRLSDYKSRDRVRVLTLWESSASTVSLQAGKRGNPSVQWTSRLMNHGGATQGLLDRLFSVSLARASNGLRSSKRTQSGPVLAKQITEGASP